MGATLGGVAVSGRVTGDDATDGTVYAVSEAGELVAFAAATGDRRWGFEFSADPPSTAGPPLVWNGTVYLNGRGRLYAVDAATGEEEWAFETDFPAISPPTIHDGSVYIQNYSGATPRTVPRRPKGTAYLYALDAETGERTWRTRSAVLTLPCQAPLVYDGSVFVLGKAAFSGGTMSAYDAETGDQLWEQGTYDGLPLRVPRYGPVALDGTVYVRGINILTGVDPDTGETVWGVGESLLRDKPGGPNAGKLSVYGQTLLSARDETMDRFDPDSERPTFRPFDNVGELGYLNSAFVVGRPTAARHPYVVVGSRPELDDGAGDDPSVRFRATTANPTFFNPDPEWTYEQSTLVNPTAAGATVFIGGAELTALDIRDGTERWSSDAFADRIVTAPTVATDPEGGHSVDERIRHQTINGHDELGPRPASFRVGAGRLSASGLNTGDEYWFPDEQIEPRIKLDYDTRYVGRIDDDRIVVPRAAVDEFRAEHNGSLGVVVMLHNTGGVATEKPVEVRVGETTLQTKVHIQGYGAGLLYLFEDVAATPRYVDSENIEAGTTTYFDSSTHVSLSGERLLNNGYTDLTVATPDHERTIRFEGAASGDTAAQTESPEGADSSNEQTEPVDGGGQDATEASGSGFGVATTPAAIAAGGYARYVWQKRNEEK
ncbi:PQQ-binding-like beta-propeller repeat protein [Natronomonas gomsonensis]|uniref:outer membrane protein assembly factor BamB family protein n=1 Tax=Natronomonas gomsonensis TaxID=1046043 RepID=UPI0020CA404A|nr:PQQ-binding-like beta-propeller repeat protein [Natronomonas gomsonensis]MCY4729964.1 PQQ-binding-like beta-propeller repeat protein [Natronomonas gomsonensis]